MRYTFRVRGMRERPDGGKHSFDIALMESVTDEALRMIAKYGGQKDGEIILPVALHGTMTEFVITVKEE